MAYNAQKIAPTDFKPSVGVGVALPLNGNAVFKTTYTSADALKANLVNWFLTNQGERPLNPSFGGNLSKFIFEQITDGTLYFIKEDIQSQLSTFFTTVQIQSLEILQNADTGVIIVDLIQGSSIFFIFF